MRDTLQHYLTQFEKRMEQRPEPDLAHTITFLKFILGNQEQNKQGEKMNKILVGKGNLKQFAEDYEKVALTNDGRMWSQTTPIDSDICKNEPEFKQAYEYIIGYEKYDKPTPVQLAKPKIQARMM